MDKRSISIVPSTAVILCFGEIRGPFHREKNEANTKSKDERDV